MRINFASEKIKENIYTGEFGIEKESLRVTPDGLLAHTPHPFSEPFIDRDFCENQVEIISSVHSDVPSLIAELEEIHRYVNRRISEKGELLWAFSNPPIVLGEDDVEIAHFDENRKSAERYRRYLSKKYGKIKMLFSGIHFNFSFSPALLQAAFDESGETDFASFKNNSYLELSKKLLTHSWLVVYLMSSSPLMSDSFLHFGGFSESDRFRYASVRCGEAGYWNDFLPLLDYSDLELYCDSIQKTIDAGLLRSSAELYYPIRLKPRGKNSLENLRENGVNHIELRMLDINPFSPVGVLREDIEFLHLLILYLMSLKDAPLSSSAQRTAIENIKSSALYDDQSAVIHTVSGDVSLKAAAKNLLDSIAVFAEESAPRYLSSLACQREKCCGSRYARRVREEFSDFINDGLALSKRYATI